MALGGVLVFISSYQLFFLPLTTTTGGVSLGTLIQTESVVKIKQNSALDWRDAYSGTDILEQQLIFTDEDSSAEIKFQEGNKLSIDENSLIRMSALKNGAGVDLQKGLVRAHVEGGRPLIVEVNGSELKLTGKNADVQIHLEENGGEIGVLGGEISVEKNGKIETIDKTTALKVSGDTLEKKKISLALARPLANEIFYTLTNQQEIILDWSPDVAAKVIISDDQSFKTRQELEGEGSATSNLSSGTFYWKVESSEGVSLVSSFKVQQEFAPEILRPKEGEKIRLPAQENLRPELFLQWKGTKAQKYLVEWEDSKINSLQVQGSGVLVTPTESGAFRWRVKIDNEKRPLSQWSSWQTLDVTLVGPPKTPTNLSPEKLELESYSKDGVEVSLSWEAQSDVELEVLNPKNQQEIKSIQGTNFPLKVKESGVYRWRVRGIDEFTRKSEWTEWKSFEVSDHAQDSEGGVQRIQLKRPDQSVTFNWQSEGQTKTIFELAESKEFSQIIISKEVAGDEVKVVIPKIGEYYWRSRQFNDDGTVTNGAPKKVLIEPAPAPTKPEKLPDIEVPVEWKETQNIPQKSWIDFFISSAYATEFKGVARIQFPHKEEAKKYVIRIFQDEAGEQLVVERILESPEMEWENVKPGHYYWQYAVIDYWDRQSPFSDLSSLIVTGEEPILPEKPKLLKPIRAQEVDKQSINFAWSESEKNKEYLLEISLSEDFGKTLFNKTLDESEFDFKAAKQLKPGLYYWRITARSSTKREMLSNTGRFTIPEEKPIERIVIADQKGTRTKQYHHQAFAAWSPSSDSFAFEGEGQKGQIDGTVLNSVELQGIYFAEKYLFNAELLRQSGKVYEEESYLFQRLLAGGTWKQKLGQHLWGPGLTLGFVSGQSYDIENGVVSAKSVSGAIYGPHVQGIYSLSESWELQGKLSYLLGAIPYLEGTFLGKREFEKFNMVFGVGYSSRTYSESEGNQTSLRVILGLGKDF